jgi:ubiquinone/menaquinone biosynthesis C-methylase UbiE
MIKTIHGWGKEEGEYVVYETAPNNTHVIYVHENQPLYKEELKKFTRTFNSEKKAFEYMAIVHNNFPDLETIEILTVPEGIKVDTKPPH